MFIHLHVHSQYSFLDGASSIETYLKKAAELEMPAIALTDHNNVSGAVEFYKQANELGIKPIQGVEITIEGGFHLTLLPRIIAVTKASVNFNRCVSAIKNSHRYHGIPLLVIKKG